MKRRGICQKCGKETEVRDHHFKGYSSEETSPYCRSCDFKAHAKARKEGRCLLTSEQAHKLSQRSSDKRRYQIPEIRASKLKFEKDRRQIPEVKLARQKYDKEHYQIPEVRASILKYEKERYQIPEVKLARQKYNKEYYQKHKLDKQ